MFLRPGVIGTDATSALPRIRMPAPKPRSRVQVVQLPAPLHGTPYHQDMTPKQSPEYAVQVVQLGNAKQNPEEYSGGIDRTRLKV